MNSCCIDFRILLTLRIEVGKWRFDQRKSVTERFVNYSTVNRCGRQKINMRNMNKQREPYVGRGPAKIFRGGYLTGYWTNSGTAI